MSLRERVLNNLEERRKKVIEGQINCIPLPFKRFREELPGIEQGKYYLISGATKASKTQLTNYLFLYNTVLYSYYNQGIIYPKIFYYNLEETEEAIMLRFMAYLLYKLSGKRVSPTDLRSTDSSKPVSEEVLELLNSDEYINILDYFEEVVSFRTSRNPTGIWKDVRGYADNHGTIHKKKYTYKDELGEEKEALAFDYYEPNIPNEYVFIIVDHVSLLESERGLSLRETINKLSEYMIILRNRFNYIPVIVQQQSVETSNLEAFKSNKIRPTMAGLSDSKYTAKDCDIMIGITNPYSHELPEYLGYDIKTLKGNFRCMEIVLNRSGQSNGLCPLYFDGAINFFNELPLPSDTQAIGRVYSHIKESRNTNRGVSLFLKGRKNNNKNLYSRKIINKFATLFSN